MLRCSAFQNKYLTFLSGSNFSGVQLLYKYREMLQNCYNTCRTSFIFVALLWQRTAGDAPGGRLDLTDTGMLHELLAPLH